MAPTSGTRLSVAEGGRATRSRPGKVYGPAQVGLQGKEKRGRRRLR
jgi:hypothetical protein